MKIIIVSLVLLSLPVYAEDIKITMSLNETFTIKDNPNWIIKNERYIPLRLADISIFSKKGYAFDLKLYFKCDTKDLSNFDTAEKIKESILASSKKYLLYCVENKIILKKLKVKRFGFYTQLTDKELIKKKEIPEGEYKYMTRGFYRVGNDSALGFSLMTNDIDSKDYRQIIDYILSFEK